MTERLEQKAHKEIYQQKAEQYEPLVSRGDHQQNILKAILAITPLKGKDCGDWAPVTGRLTCMLAPWSNPSTRSDASEHMLAVAERKLKDARFDQLAARGSATTAVFPVPNGCADIINLSGWSICYPGGLGGEKLAGRCDQSPKRDGTRSQKGWRDHPARDARHRVHDPDTP